MQNHWGLILTGLIFWLLTCAAIFDIARKDFGRVEKKFIWAIVAMVPFIGVLTYFAVGARRGRPKRAIAAAPPKC